MLHGARGGGHDERRRELGVVPGGGGGHAARGLLRLEEVRAPVWRDPGLCGKLEPRQRSTVNTTTPQLRIQARPASHQWASAVRQEQDGSELCIIVAPRLDADISKIGLIVLSLMRKSHFLSQLSIVLIYCYFGWLRIDSLLRYTKLFTNYHIHY